MNIRLAYCIDCEWQGKQSEVTMKWGQRRCPKCGGRRVEIRKEAGAIEAAVDDYDQLRHIGDLGGTELA